MFRNKLTRDNSGEGPVVSVATRDTAFRMGQYPEHAPQILAAIAD